MTQKKTKSKGKKEKLPDTIDQAICNLSGALRIIGDYIGDLPFDDAGRIIAEALIGRNLQNCKWSIGFAIANGLRLQLAGIGANEGPKPEKPKPSVSLLKENFRDKLEKLKISLDDIFNFAGGLHIVKNKEHAARLIVDTILDSNEDFLYYVNRAIREVYNEMATGNVESEKVDSFPGINGDNVKRFTELYRDIKGATQAFEKFYLSFGGSQANVREYIAAQFGALLESLEPGLFEYFSNPHKVDINYKARWEYLKTILHRSADVSGKDIIELMVSIEATPIDSIGNAKGETNEQR